MERPRPSHLDTRDPAKAATRDIRQEADREIDAYGDDPDVVLLLPEDRWAEFLRLTGGRDRGGETTYRGVTFRKAAVTAVVAQEGF
jgi:hypothetical protein